MRAPVLGLTSSQTVGPFFEGALLREDARCQALVGPEVEGKQIRIEGRILDGDGGPVPDALIEIWQADARGRYHHPADRRARPPNPEFTGFGRTGTDEGGRYWFATIKPGPIPFDGETTQAPHIVVTVLARGLLNHLVTRLYFADEAANESDPVLRQVPAERRATLLAEGASADDTVVYRFDIVLQGEGETVFFNL